MPHEAFRYAPEDAPALADAGFYAMQIERWCKRDTWHTQLQRVPLAHREAAAAHLRNRYRIIEAAKRREEKRKQCEEGDAEVERLQKLMETL